MIHASESTCSARSAGGMLGCLISVATPCSTHTRDVGPKHSRFFEYHSCHDDSRFFLTDKIPATDYGQTWGNLFIGDSVRSLRPRRLLIPSSSLYNERQKPT
jgi:hypothetical protein